MGEVKKSGPLTWRDHGKDNTWVGRYHLEETGPLEFGWDGEEGIYTNDEQVFILMGRLFEEMRDMEAFKKRLPKGYLPSSPESSPESEAWEDPDRPPLSPDWEIPKSE